jgi:hypothetical protein
MRVTITTAGHSVDLESTEDGMNIHRLANIAVNTWRRTQLPRHTAGAWGASGGQFEQQYREAAGSVFGFGDPPLDVS